MNGSPYNDKGLYCSRFLSLLLARVFALDQIHYFFYHLRITRRRIKWVVIYEPGHVLSMITPPPGTVKRFLRWALFVQLPLLFPLCIQRTLSHIYHYQWASHMLIFSQLSFKSLRKCGVRFTSRLSNESLQPDSRWKLPSPSDEMEIYDHTVDEEWVRLGAKQKYFSEHAWAIQICSMTQYGFKQYFPRQNALHSQIQAARVLPHPKLQWSPKNSWKNRHKWKMSVFSNVLER